jgi:glycosyltransferase involved in cell wall biosynthesis/Tfp pilus assembly protein PilF
MPIRVNARPMTAAVESARLPFDLPRPPADRKQLPQGISFCMIVKNEERFLEQCLRSIADVADEICIVDTGSTDRTVEIAQSFGAKISYDPWRNDFGWSRNKSLDMATRRWIFQIDADEELLPESADALASLAQAPAGQTGVWIRCNNAADDYAGTGTMSHALVRVFPNAPEIRFKGMIHEFVTIDDSRNGIKAVMSPIAIVHHGYLKEVVAERNKGQRNLEIVRAATLAEPEDPFHWFNLGMTAYIVGENELARDSLEKMLDLNAGERRGFLCNGLSTLADVYNERLREPEKGLAAAKKAIELSPHYANAHFAMGKSYLLLHRLDDARAAYLAAIEDGAHLKEQFVVDDQVPLWKAHSEIGTTYVQEGNDAKAVEWFEKGIANMPTAQPIRLNRAKALDRLNRVEEARAAFAELFEEFGDEATTLNYANFLLRHNHNLEAVDLIEKKALDLLPRTAVAMLVAAAAVAQKSNWPDAHRYLERAATIHPGAAEALNPLEAHYREVGDNDGVTRLLDAESRRAPETPADFLRRSYRAIADGAFAEGIELAKQGRELSPGNEALGYNAAICAVNLGLKHDTLTFLDGIAPGAGPVGAQAAYLRAMTLRELGRLPEALNAVDSLLQVDPTQTDALVLRATLLEGLGHAPEAEDALLRILAHDPRVAVELAGLYLRQGRLDDAKRIAEQALS